MKAALRWYLPLVIVAVTLNLRPALLTLGLVLPAIQRTLALSPFGAGALSALPIFALGLASAIAVPIGRRLGWSGALVFALILVGAGTLLRSAGTEVALYSGAFILGIGIGLGNVYVPTLVKARLASRIGLAMGGYTTMLTVGALISIATGPPFLAHFGDWRPALAVWAFPALAAALLALPLLVDNVRPGARIAGSGLLRNGLAWAISCYMGLQSAMFYAMALWMGSLIAMRGVALHDVAADLSVFYFTQFIGAIFTPWLLTRTPRQDIMAAAVAATTGALVVAVLYAPLVAIFPLCAILGVVLGAMFAVALTFPVIRARTVDNSARLSSMALCFGYMIASGGPLVLGLVNHSAHARLESAIWMAILTAMTATAGAISGRPRFVDAANA